MNNRELAVCLARRELVNCIYSSVRVEGLNMTFAQTRSVIAGTEIYGVTADDVLFVVNMMEAWRFVLETLDEPINLMYVRQLNKICGRSLIYGSGDLRTTDVRITRCSYIPSIPQYAEVVESLRRISEIDDGLKQAIEVFQYLAKAQLFIDGNKRMAQLVANKVLISSGLGILRIPYAGVKEFVRVLVGYYENSSESLSEYLIKNCLVLVKETEYGS